MARKKKEKEKRVYFDALNADDQISMEEAIASIIDDAQDSCLSFYEKKPFDDRYCNDLGKQILLLVLKKFRPDLIVEE